jgi:hypothetical protein
VVVLDRHFPLDRIPDALGDAQPLIRLDETVSPDTRGCAAFVVDEGRIDIDAIPEIGEEAFQIVRASPIYRVGSTEIAPRPEYVIARGELEASKHWLKEALDEAAQGLRHVGRLSFVHEESILDQTHVFRLEMLGKDETRQPVIEASVALAIVEVAVYITDEVRFEVACLQRSRAEVPPPRERGESEYGEPTYIEYSKLLRKYGYARVRRDSAEGPEHRLIAVVDGYFEKHPAVEWAKKGLTTLGWDAVGMDAHGVACAGVAAASQVQSCPHAGTYPGAKILPVQVYDPAVRAHDELALARGIVGAVKMGASVISISLAWRAQTSAVVDAALQYAEQKERVVVAAAGNSREGEDDRFVWYPARYDTVIAVGAARRYDGLLERVVDAWPVGPKNKPPRDEVRWSSAYGRELDVVAKGVYVTTIDLSGLSGESENDYWLRFRGTSAAAPAVAGVAACLREREGLTAASQVRDRLAEVALRPPNVASPGFNVLRPTAGGHVHPYSEQLGYGWIDRYSVL